MKPKLLHFSSSYFPRIGGIPSYIRAAAHQTADVFEHHLVCRDLVRHGGDPVRAPCGEDRSDPAITIHRLWSDGSYFTEEMAGFIRDFDYDVLMIHTPNPALLQAAKLAGRRKVILAAQCKSEMDGVGELLEYVEHMMVLLPSYVEHYARRYGVAREKMTVLPRLVDVEMFKPGPTRAYQGRKRYHLLYVGRIAPEKRVWELPGVLRELRDRNNGRYTLDIVGDYDHPFRDEPPLQEAIDANRVRGSVHFSVAHTPEEMAAAYQRADVLVAASERETFCQVFLEALACGLPVVTTAGRGVREWALGYVDFVDGVDGMVEAIKRTRAPLVPQSKYNLFRRVYSWQARKADFVEIVEGMLA